MGQLLCCLRSLIHLNEIFVHFRKMLVDELVYDLRGQINPDV
jgi:hypothetical protein